MSSAKRARLAQHKRRQERFVLARTVHGILLFQALGTPKAWGDECQRFFWRQSGAYPAVTGTWHRVQNKKDGKSGHGLAYLSAKAAVSFY